MIKNTFKSSEFTKALQEDMYKKLDILEKSLGYVFSHKILACYAITLNTQDRRNYYQRMEFLGDTILSAIVSTYIYHHYQDATEGEMTLMRSSLVCTDTLSKIANYLQLRDLMVMKEEDIPSKKIYADCVESLIAAIHLDCESNYLITSKVILDLYDKANITLNQKSHPKAKIQEILQSKHKNSSVNELIQYTVVNVQGEDHQRVFTVQLCILGKCYYGTGKSIKEAEKHAAEVALTEH